MNSVKFVPQVHLVQSASITLALLMLLFFAGCDPSDRPPLARVKGAVTLDGKPITRGVIVFRPENARASTAEFDQDGRYDLIYIRDIHGAVLGSHTVIIATSVENSLRERVPAKYNRESILKAEVKDGDNVINFDLESS